MRRAIPSGATVIIKVGSSSLTTTEGEVGEGVRRAVNAVAVARRLGYPAVLVSSGAVAAGLPALGLTGRPTEVVDLQVAAAVGQGRLMERYAATFAEIGVTTGQVLLTMEVLSNRGQYLNARAALTRMLAAGIVPIVNENDTVVVEELRLGDNDRLAAIVSHLVGAGLLLILTDTEGLFSADPRMGEAELLSAVRHADEMLDRLTGVGPLGSGGVATKVAAARMAAWSGVPTVVAAITADRVVERALAGDEVGTWVDPRGQPLPARKLWIAFGQAPAGVVVIDDGAVRALVEQARSLLPVGVTHVEGKFGAGTAVEVHDRRRRLVAKGIARMDARTLDEVKGQRSELEAIHRDDLVVLQAPS
jgi:glutamate 5-kinase